MNWLGDLFARFRWVVALTILAVTIAAGIGITRLEFDDDLRNFFKAEDGEFAQLQTLFDDFGSDDNDCLVVVECDKLFAKANIEAASRLADALREAPHVESVQSIFAVREATKRKLFGRSVMIDVVPEPSPDRTDESYQKAKERALANPLIAGQLLTDDAKTTLLVVRLAGGSLKTTEIDPIVDNLRQIIDEKVKGTELTARLSGIPPIRVEIVNSIQRDLVKFNVIGALLSFAIALVLLRRIAAVYMAVIPPMLGALWIMGAMGWLGLKVNVLNSVVPTLALVVGFSDSVHFVLDLRRSFAAAIPMSQASRTAIHHVGVACGLTSITTAVGFGSLAVAQVPVIREFGIACAVGSILTFVAVMLVVPLLASTFMGRYIGAPTEPSQWLGQRLANQIIGWSAKQPFLITGVGIAVTVMLAVVSMRLQPDNSLTEDIPTTNESYQALKYVDDKFGGAMFVYGAVEWPEHESISSDAVQEVLAEVEAAFERNDQTHNPLSVLNLIATLPNQDPKYLEPKPKDAPEKPQAPAQDLTPEAAAAKARSERKFADADKSMTRLVRLDKRRAVVTAHVQDVGAAKLEPELARLDTEFAAIQDKHPGFKVHLTGSAVVASRNVNQMIRDLGNSLGLESLIIFGIMTWAFRSFGFGLISILPNVFPLVCVAALIVLSGEPLELSSVIVFNICLGLAVDDTIHFMTRLRRELQTEPDMERAMATSFSTVGTAVLTTTAILLVGFGTVMLSEVPSLRVFGRLSCVTVLTALVAELIMLPSLVLSLARVQKFMAERFGWGRPTLEPVKEAVGG